MKINKILIFLLFLLPFFLVFRNFFTDSILSWGDAPYFYKENLHELFNRPFAWDIRNTNFGGPNLLAGWLFLPTFLIGVLYKTFSLSSDISLRLVFYFPSVILGGLGSYFFLSIFTKNYWSKFFGSFFYLFNTYLLMLIDGGQIGFALGYGFYPLIMYSFIKLFNKQNLKYFSLSLLLLLLVSNIDLRITLLFLFSITVFIFLRSLFNKSLKYIRQNLILLASIAFIVILLDAFWVIPFIYGLIDGYSISSSDTGLNFVNLLHPLLLYHPNFPLNEFGTVLQPAFYYSFFLLLFMLALSFKAEGKIKLFRVSFLAFLILSFVTKGRAEPLGFIYESITSLPLGSAFRDSTKFFVPLILVTSLLIGLTIERFKNYLQNTKLYIIFLSCLYIYLVILIYPALGNGLSGGLNNPANRGNFEIIYEFLSKKEENFRTLWFNEKPPLGYTSYKHPALSANLLFQERPFASMIDGDYDLFNYLHHKNLRDWLSLFGVKYVVVSGNEREKIVTSKESLERQKFLSLVEKTFQETKVEIGSGIPIYELNNNLPPLFAQDKLYFVLGGEEVYEELFKLPRFNLPLQSLVFIEQGIDIKDFFKFKKEAIGIIYSNKNTEDLALSLFVDKMINLIDAPLNEWLKKDTAQYLSWKAELKKHNLNTLDFDFGKGVSISTIKNEKIKTEITVTEAGEYYIFSRLISSGKGININLNNIDYEVNSSSKNSFEWQIIGPIKLSKGKYILEITNKGGVVGLNTIILVTNDEFSNALSIAKKMEKFSTPIDLRNKFDIQKIMNPSVSFLTQYKSGGEINPPFFPVEYKMINPSEYSIIIPEKANWLVFADRYHPRWNLEQAIAPLPVYATLNGFYIGDLKKNEYVSLKFGFQEYADKGLIVSILALLLLIVGGCVYLLSKRLKLIK